MKSDKPSSERRPLDSRGTISGHFFDDFEEEQVFLSSRRTVTEFAIEQFASLTGALNPLFFDREYVTELYGGLIAPGQFTLSLALGLTEPLVHGTVVAMLGLDEVTFKAPVLAGETIQVRTRVLATRPTRRPDAGIVQLESAVFRAVDDPPVMTFRRAVLVRREEGA